MARQQRSTVWALALLLAGAVVGLVCDSAPGQQGGTTTPTRPPAASWATSGSDPAAAAAAAPPQVIATSKPGQPAVLPPDARLPLPDDGLRTTTPPPADAKQGASKGPPPAPVQQAHHVAPGPLPGLGGSGGIPSQAGEAIQLVGGQVPTGRQAQQQPTPTLPQQTQGSALGVEVVGPPSLTPGQVLAFQVIARNLGPSVLAGVRIDLPVPAGARIVSTTPAVSRAKDVLTWDLGNVEAGVTRELKVEMQSTQPGELHLRPAARFSAAVGLRTTLVQPPFSVVATGPETATVGGKVTFQIRVGNHTPAPLQGVVLTCDLGQGLAHDQGNFIQADLGELAPGEVRTIPLDVRARTTGKLSSTMTVTARGGHKAEAQASVMVSDPALTMKLDGPRTGNVGNEMTYKLELANPGKSPAPELRIQQLLPEGLEFVSAGDGGTFDSRTRVITWSLPGLAPDTHRALPFLVRPKRAGDWALVATGRGDGLQDVRLTHAVRVIATPTLSLEMTAQDNPLRTGEDTIYELRIYNPGPQSANALRLIVQVPDNLEARGADGVTRGQLRGNQVLFDPIVELKPRVDTIFKLHLRGARVGMGTVKASLLADGMVNPVTQEVPCRVQTR